MINQTQRSSARGWALPGATIAIAALIIAVVTSCGSGSSDPRTATVSRVAAAPEPPTATLQFTPTRLANGARGTVSVTPSGKAAIRLTITLAVPSYSTYGIALWSDKSHLTDLYSGAKGTNIQTMAINLQTLARYKLIEVGYQEVRTQVVRNRSRHRATRFVVKSVNDHALLYVLTGELLNKLVAAKGG
jgi:hypothetical protein